MSQEEGVHLLCRRGDSIPGWGRCPGEGKITHLSILAWELPGQRSLAGHSPRGHQSDMTERTQLMRVYMHMETNYGVLNCE